MAQTYLDFQLLYHLHLDSTLGRTPVVQGVFAVEVSARQHNTTQREDEDKVTDFFTRRDNKDYHCDGC